MADVVRHELITKLALAWAAKDDKFKDDAKKASDAAAAAKAANAAVDAADRMLAEARVRAAVAEATAQAAEEEAAVAKRAKATEAVEEAEAAAYVAAEARKEASSRAADLDKEFDKLVEKLAGSGWLPDMVTFTGYAAEKVTWPVGGDEWQLLYTDLPLVKWLLVEDDGIVFSTTIEDDRSPFKKRDVLWVDEDASVGMGMGSQSVEARFLTGKFTRAGDFGAPPGGGTVAASTGVFCEANTVGCCTKKSTN
jgi:hypothetical protein